VTPIDLLKWTGGPGSMQLLLMVTALGVWLHFRRPRQRLVARAILGTTTLVYWILATPVTALAIEDLLPKPSTGNIDQGSSFDTVVVLDGDNRRGRLAEALVVWRARTPKRLIVSGQPWLRDELIAAGVPEERVNREAMASNTRQQIAWLTALMSEPSTGHVAVIASRLQAPRVAALIRRAGGRAAILAAPIDTEPRGTGPWALVPSYSALRLSRDALYECLALRYYEARGWIDSPAVADFVAPAHGILQRAWFGRA
jgi:uncharacterized SAM-binding protein YcdF (DUF218 family)